LLRQILKLTLQYVYLMPIFMKKIKCNHLLILVICIFCGINSFAQESLNTNEITSNWNVISQSSELTMLIRKEDVKVGPLKQPLSYLFLKIENNTSNEIVKDIQLAMNFSYGCEGCESNKENIRRFTIAPNSSIEGDNTFQKGELSYLINNPNFGEIKTLISIELIDIKK
jgi:hypothetical protein